MTTDELKNLESFLQQDIPFIPKKVKTFFDIGGFASKEVIISRFYAYYFDPNESHGFNDLFLSSLLLVIGRENERQKKQLDLLEIESFRTCTVNREVYTANGKYIDILIEGSDLNSEKIDSTIVIENKIFYKGDNPWNEYVNHSKSTNCTVGVILSLTYDNREKCHNKFVNVKHSVLLREVEKNLGSCLLSSDLQQVALLKEFILTMQSMEPSKSTEVGYSFLIKNSEKIKKINNLTKSVNDNTIHQLGRVCENINELYELNLFYKKVNIYNDGSNLKEYVFFREKNEYLSLSIGFYDISTIFVHIHLIRINKDLSKKLPETDYVGDEVEIDKSFVNKPWHLYAKLEFELDKENYTNSYNYIFARIVENKIVNVYKKTTNAIQSDLPQ